MTDSLMTVPEPAQHALSPLDMSLDELKARANILIEGGFLPSHIKTPQQAIAVIRFGLALGIQPEVAVHAIFPTASGSLSMYTATALGLAYRSGLMEDYSYTFDEKGDVCTVTVKRKGYSPVHFWWGDKDEANAGLANKDSHRKYPRHNKIWRATIAALRLAFPDILGAIYTAEELDEDRQVSRASFANDTIDAEVVPTEINDWFDFAKTVGAYGKTMAEALYLIRCKDVPEAVVKYKTPQGALDALLEVIQRDSLESRKQGIVDFVTSTFEGITDKALSIINDWLAQNPDGNVDTFDLGLVMNEEGTGIVQ